MRPTIPQQKAVCRVREELKNW